MQEMWETWVQFLGQEDPLEEGMATHTSILAWRTPGHRSWWATVHSVIKHQTRLKRLGTHARNNENNIRQTLAERHSIKGLTSTQNCQGHQKQGMRNKKSLRHRHSQEEPKTV